MQIGLKRVYETTEQSDGVRILVERLWPRGLTKEDAKIDLWAKEAAPSHELRRWFNHDAARWVVFKRRYLEELEERREAVEPILDRARRGRVTFVFATREERYNNAAVLREFVEQELRVPATRTKKR